MTIVARKRIKVLHVLLDLKVGGMQRLMVDLLGRFDPELIDVDLVVLGDAEPLKGEVPPSVCFRDMGIQSRFSMIRPKALAELVGRVGPDVVHTHSGCWYKAVRAARMAGAARVFYTDHGRPKPDPRASRVLDSLASRQTDQVVAVSDSVRDQLRTFVARPDDTVVVLNGVDCERFRPEGPGLREELGLPSETLVIGGVGRFEPVKGFDVMIRAFAALSADWQGLQPVLVLAGDGSTMSELRALADDLGVGRSVRFLGLRSDVPAFLRTLDVFSLGSRSEGTSISLLEAMACGVCPAVTDVGGNGHVLGEALKRNLVPSEKPRAMAALWADLLADPWQRRQLAEAGRDRVAAAFSIDATVRAYEGLYVSTCHEEKTG